MRAFRPSRPFAFAAPSEFARSKTSIHVRLLGPCYKTGRTNPFHQRHGGRRPKAPRPDPKPPVADFSDDERSKARAARSSPAAPDGAIPLSTGASLASSRPRPNTLPPAPRTARTKNLMPRPAPLASPRVGTRSVAVRRSRADAASAPRPLRLGCGATKARARRELPTPVNSFVRFSQ